MTRDERLSLPSAIRWLLAVIVLTPLFGCVQRSSPPQVKLKYQPESIGALGTLVPSGEFISLRPDVDDSTSSPQVIDQLLVKEGQHLVEGQPIALFSKKRNILNERKHLVHIISLYRKQLNESSEVLKRFQTITVSGAYPLSTFQERVIFHQGIQARLSEALLSLDQNDARLRASTLRAPINGVVTSIYSHTGEAVSSDGVIQMADLSSLQARLEVHESDLKAIKIGQKVTIQSDTGSFSGSVTGHVALIVPGIRQRSTLPTSSVPNVDVRVGVVRVDIDPQYIPRLRNFVGTKLIARIQE